METKKCPFCAEEILTEAIKCKHCGSMLIPLQTQPSQAPLPKVQEKRITPSAPPFEPIAAGLLSCLLIAGLGHLFLRQYTKAVIMMGADLVLLFFVFPIWIFYRVLSGIDAYKIGKKLEQGNAVGEWESF